MRRSIPPVEHRFFRYDRIDSTNERALVAIAAGRAAHGDVHVALEQTAGRGRRGRSWRSARGEGLTLTLVLLPARAPNPSALTMGAGLAVVEAVIALGAREARLKWPNDVLVDERKLAGILVEARGLEPAHAVVGVGLNVAQHAFAPELVKERPVTSLALLGVRCSLAEAEQTLLVALARRMAEACERAESVARDYAADLGLLGRAVRVSVGHEPRQGHLMRLALDGIELAREDSGVERIPLEHVQALEGC
jgi:BirA family biotin operon repressor/biotin-[acetyl-CoA-carboxylase] ligase